MTSEKTSANVFRYTFLSTLKNNFYIPLIAFVALLILFPVTALFTIKSYSAMASVLSSSSEHKFTDEFFYLITSKTNILSDFITMIPFATAFVGVIMGVTLFRFVTKMPASNVFFSVGIKRSKLFTATFLAGAVMIFAAIAVPMLLDLLINISYFGYSFELGTSLLYLSLGILTIFFVSFTLSCLVMSVVGTSFEGVVYSSLLLLLPLIFLYGIEPLMNVFLFGSKYNVTRFYFGYGNSLNSISFADDYKFLNPFNALENIDYYTLLSKDHYIGYFNAGYYNDGYISSDMPWIQPAYATIIGWLATAAVLFLIGLILFKRRRVEITGKLASDKRMNFVMTFILGFSAFCVCAYYLGIKSDINVFGVAGISLLAFAAVYLLLDAALIHNFKLYVKGLIKLPVHLAVMVAICLTLSVGLFGYSTRVPDVSEIKSAEITVPAGYLTGSNYSVGAMSSSIHASCLTDTVKGFESESDLKLLTALHKQILESGKQKASNNPSKNDAVYGNIYIRYNLKNGKTVTRCYNAVKSPALKAFLKVEDTDNYKNQVQSIFTEKVKKSDSDSIKAFKKLVQNPDGEISFYNSQLSTDGPQKMSTDLRNELLNCLAADLFAQSYKERYFSDRETIGAILFKGILDPWDEKSNKAYASGALCSLANHKDLEYRLVITSDMVNTVAFLNKNNLIADDANKIVSANVVSVKDYLNYNDYYAGNTGLSFQFMGGKWSDKETDSFDYPSYNLSDENLLNTMKSVSYYSYYTISEGYFVRYTLDNGDKLIMFVPENLMPKSVRDGVSKMTIYKH